MTELAQQLRAERLGRHAQRARALGLADRGAGDDHDVLRDQVDAEDAGVALRRRGRRPPGEHRVQQAAADDLTVAANVLHLVEIGLRDDADDDVREAHEDPPAPDHGQQLLLVLGRRGRGELVVDVLGEDAERVLDRRQRDALVGSAREHAPQLDHLLVAG